VAARLRPRALHRQARLQALGPPLRQALHVHRAGHGPEQPVPRARQRHALHGQRGLQDPRLLHPGKSSLRPSVP
jgi:hypothetical protein